jgi:hypothetical protein
MGGICRRRRISVGGGVGEGVGLSVGEGLGGG